MNDDSYICADDRHSGFVTGLTYSSKAPDAHAFRYSLVDNLLLDLGVCAGLCTTSRAVL